jgi:hypothetical protein
MKPVHVLNLITINHDITRHYITRHTTVKHTTSAEIIWRSSGLKHHVSSYKTTLRHNPEDHKLNLHRHETIKSRLSSVEILMYFLHTSSKTMRVTQRYILRYKSQCSQEID